MANPNENRINTTITAGDLTSIDTGFTGINTSLDTYAQALTEEERAQLFSLAEENKVFASDALEQGLLLSPQFPPMLQAVVTNMQTDSTLHDQLEKIMETQVLPLMMKVKDTMRLAAHEKYVAALTVYKMIETGAGMGMPGFQAAFDILKGRFAGQGGRPAGTP